MASPVRLKVLGYAARAAAALVALTAAFGAAFVAEGAAKTRVALERAHAAVEAHRGDMLRESLSEAADVLETSWARPLEWHAGALEARSWLYAQQAALRPDPVLIDASAQAAIDSLDRDPVQPAAWARLAGLASAGFDQTRCTLRECLIFSWRAARMAEDDIACPRLQIAYDNRLLRPDDVRITWVARADYWGSVMRRCVSFMRPADMFRALMIAEQDRAEREARRAIR